MKDITYPSATAVEKKLIFFHPILKVLVQTPPHQLGIIKEPWSID